MTWKTDIVIIFVPFELHRPNLVCSEVCRRGLWETNLICINLHKFKMADDFDPENGQFNNFCTVELQLTFTFGIAAIDGEVPV